jgi:hypothetical protein
MNKARPKYPTNSNGNIYIDNIQKAVVICLIISTTFPLDAESITIQVCKSEIQRLKEKEQRLVGSESE